MPAEPPIAVLAPSPVRRWLAVTVISGLGAMCLAIIVLAPPARPALVLVLIAVAAGAFWLARALAVATRRRIVLVEAGLRDDAGRMLAPIGSILGVERGVFAFKPSNGFLVRLDAPAGRAWAPGLWWRMGRRLGVGGVTSGAQARIMADALSVLLAQRAQAGRGG